MGMACFSSIHMLPNGYISNIKAIALESRIAALPRSAEETSNGVFYEQKPLLDFHYCSSHSNRNNKIKKNEF